MMPRYKTAWVLALFVVWNAGCPSPTSAPGDGRDQDEKAVGETFVALRQAVEKHDADGVLALFDEESHARLERVAGDKSRNARDLVKNDLLPEHPYDEYSECTLTQVTVQGDTATADVTAPDGDRYRLTFVREGGRWKVRAPKAPE
jgi:hypothetical protein